MTIIPSINGGGADRVFEAAAELFALLSAPARLRIVCELFEGEKSVGELLDRVDVRQDGPAATGHRCAVTSLPAPQKGPWIP